MLNELTPQQVQTFLDDGFLIVENFVPPAVAARVAARYEGLFRGEFETGLYPDEWNWKEGRDKPDLARQICNGWKSDHSVASLVLRPEVGKLCAQLAGWPGARIAQDNVVWKPPGAKSLGFHQDDSYNGWIDPPHMLTCWIALDPPPRVAPPNMCAAPQMGFRRRSSSSTRPTTTARSRWSCGESPDARHCAVEVRRGCAFHDGLLGCRQPAGRAVPIIAQPASGSTDKSAIYSA
jgi:hypothetical protein